MAYSSSGPIPGNSSVAPTSRSVAAELVQQFVDKLIEPSARIKDEWMYEHVEPLDRTEGEIDMLQQRLAAIRTWTYAANRADWLETPKPGAAARARSRTSSPTRSTRR